VPADRSTRLARLLRRLVALLLVVPAVGCGSQPDRLPPAAEPAAAPPLDAKPAGRVVPLGARPEGMVFDSVTGLLAVGLAGPDRLALVDGGSGRVVRRIPLPAAPRHLALAGPGGPVLVPAERANALVRVSLPGGRAETTPVGRTPHDAAASGGRVAVGNEFGDSVSVLEGDRVIRTLAAPTQPGGLVALGGGRVGVVGVRENALDVLDLRGLRSEGRTGVGQGPTHLASDGKDNVFVADTRGTALLFVRTGPELGIFFRKQLAGAPYGIAHDRERGRTWVTLPGRNELVEFTGRGQRSVLPTVRQANSVAVDERSGRLFVGGRAEGVLQIVDP
jgi:DNA-binding beta-propeller fold protein YncE